MSDWINHPITQSIFTPFVTAWITTKLFNHNRLSGLALIAGFCSTVYLVADFNFESLSTIKKIILLGLIAAIIGLLLDLATLKNKKFARYLLATACSIVPLWMLWPVLLQKEIQEAAVYGISIALYMMWLTILVDCLSTKSTRAGSVGMSMGIAISISASLGSSAILGQLGLSIGISCCAFLLVQLISGKTYSCGRTFTLPLSILCGLIMPATIVFAQAPWYSLAVVAAIPVAAFIPLPKNWSLRKQVIILSILTIVIATSTILVDLILVPK